MRPRPAGPPSRPTTFPTAPHHAPSHTQVFANEKQWAKSQDSLRKLVGSFRASQARV